MTMRAQTGISWGAFVACAALFLSGSPARSQEVPIDSLSASFRASLGRLTTPELEQRIATRRRMQREGYSDVLLHSVRNDGLWGVISSLRSTFQLEYSLPREPLIIFIPIRQPERRNDHLPGFTGAPSPPMAVPLLEDRTFPRDPWSKK